MNNAINNSTIKFLCFSLLAIILGQFYIVALIDIFHYKFFQDTIVIFESNPIFFGNGSFDSARFLLAPYISILGFFGVELENYQRYSGIDFHFTNIFFCIINSLIYFIGVFSLRQKTNDFGKLIFIIIYILYVPYIGVPGKETNTLILGYLLFYMLAKNGGASYFVPIIGIIALYAAGGRYYYFLFIASFIFLSRIDKSNYWILAIMGLLVFSAISSFEEVRLAVQFARPDLSEMSNSFISLPFDDIEYTGFLLNRIYLFILLMIPIEMLQNSLYIPYFILGIGTTYLICYGIKFKGNSIENNCAVAILSFIISQALFEPDFGSIFRHRTFILPFILYLAASRLQITKISEIRVTPIK